MALDVYVMPLWQFKVGNFTSQAEDELGVASIVVAPGGSTKELSPEEGRAAAEREVELLKAQLAKITGTAIEWPDDGEVRYNKQFYDPTVLRAFAAWHDHRDALPEFSAPPKLNYGQHPVWKLSPPPRRRFPTLVDHDLYIGYFLPVPFAGVHHLEPFKSWGDQELFHHVASTQTILRELADLLEFLPTVPAVREPEHGSIPVGDARWYAEELQRICTLSLQHRLPVIFHG